MDHDLRAFKRRQEDEAEDERDAITTITVLTHPQPRPPPPPTTVTRSIALLLCNDPSLLCSSCQTPLGTAHSHIIRLIGDSTPSSSSSSSSSSSLSSSSSSSPSSSSSSISSPLITSTAFLLLSSCQSVHLLNITPSFRDGLQREHCVNQSSPHSTASSLRLTNRSRPCHPLSGGTSRTCSWTSLKPTR
jgi:hypothetical protein